MRKFDFWKTDWVLGVIAISRAPSDKIALIAIDEPGIRSIVRYLVGGVDIELRAQA